MSVLRRLLKYVRPYWKELVGVSVLLLLRTGLNLLTPLVQREVVDQVMADRDLARRPLLIAALIGIDAFSQAASFGDMFLRHAVGDGVRLASRLVINDPLRWSPSSSTTARRPGT